MSNDRCLFCRIVAGDITAKKVYDDDSVVAFEDINPQAPTHVLVVPRKHIPSVAEMTDADAPIVGTVIARAAKLAKDLRLQDGYRLVVNNGDAAGQTVFHIHVHLLGGRSFGWPPG